MSTEYFLRLIFLIAKKANYELDKFEMNLITDELRMMGFDRVSEVLKEIYLSMRSGDRFPSVDEIKRKCDPTYSLKAIDHAVDASTRIVTAIKQFGYASPKEAEEYIGELGWTVVKASGGWSRICNELTVDNTATVTAQLRSRAEVFHKKCEAGILDLPPKLPSPRFISLSQTIGLLPEYIQ